MNRRAIFVTGTDTGVGKTVVSAVIARLARERVNRVGVMKPVTSGCILQGEELVSEDAELLRFSSGCEAPQEDVAPYRLLAPLAPSVAASREGKKIDFGVVADALRRLEADHDFVVVEGAGGLMVPLAGGLLVADLVKRLDIPLLVVARPGLGTVNHTLLTCFAARQMGIEIRGIVINGYPDEPGPAEEYAPHLLGSLSGAPVLGIFPQVAEQDPSALLEMVAEAARRHPLTQFLMREIGLV